MGAKIVLVGGCGSGKSARAVEVALRADAAERLFIATAAPFDDVMRAKIDRHREERGDDFKTVEERIMLADALAPFAADPSVCAVVDCLTVWLCNIARRADMRRITDGFLERFGSFQGTVIAVTNETGMGIIPSDRQTRDYAAALADINRKAVSLADEAYLLVAGEPLRIKPGGMS